MKPALFLPTALILALAAVAAPAQILSYSGTGKILGLGAGPTSPIEERAVGFTMGAASEDVTSLTLSLSFAASLASTDFTVSLYQASDANASSAPAGTLVGSFADPSFTFDGATRTYTFTPQADIVLDAGATYWLVLQDADPGTNVVNWIGGTAGSVSGTAGSQVVVSGTGGSIFSSQSGITHLVPNAGNLSGSTGDFQIFANAVPEPPAALLLGGAGLAVLAARRLRSRAAPGSV